MAIIQLILVGIVFAMLGFKFAAGKPIYDSWTTKQKTTFNTALMVYAIAWLVLTYHSLWWFMESLMSNTKVDTSREHVEKVINCAPFADNTAGIPEMVEILKSLLDERDELEAILVIKSRRRKWAYSFFSWLIYFGH
jgi:hypothetical protein